MSGGWDRTLQIHDLRTNGPIGSIYGPMVSGDAIDVCEGKIVAASQRGKDPLQVFDLGTRK